MYRPSSLLLGSIGIFILLFLATQFSSFSIFRGSFLPQAETTTSYTLLRRVARILDPENRGRTVRAMRSYFREVITEVRVWERYYLQELNCGTDGCPPIHLDRTDIDGNRLLTADDTRLLSKSLRRLLRCGNEQKDDPEECDDGNTLDGDGCSAICLLEKPHGKCMGGDLPYCTPVTDDGPNECSNNQDCGGTDVQSSASSSSTSPVNGNSCGNHVNTDDLGNLCTEYDRNIADLYFNGQCLEQCDDGNQVNGDGCNTTCHIDGECFDDPTRLFIEELPMPSSLTVQPGGQYVVSRLRLTPRCQDTSLMKIELMTRGLNAYKNIHILEAWYDSNDDGVAETPLDFLNNPSGTVTHYDELWTSNETTSTLYLGSESYGPSDLSRLPPFIPVGKSRLVEIRATIAQQPVSDSFSIGLFNYGSQSVPYGIWGITDMITLRNAIPSLNLRSFSLSIDPSNPGVLPFTLHTMGVNTCSYSNGCQIIVRPTSRLMDVRITR